MNLSSIWGYSIPTRSTRRPSAKYKHTKKHTKKRGRQIIQRASQFSKGVTGNVSALIRSAFRCAPLSISDADIAPNMKRTMTKTTRRISTALSVLDEFLLYVAKAIHNSIMAMLPKSMARRILLVCQRSTSSLVK